MLYTRDTMGRITTVQSRKVSTDPWANIATSVVYQPMSRIVQSFAAGNSLSNSCTYTSDYELNLSGVYDGATKLIERSHSRTDKLNLTNIGDNVTAANSMSFWANPANRLQNADGPWGQKTFYYDGVGNRTHENTTVSGTTTSDNLQYNGTSNRVQSVVRGGTTTVRAFTPDRFRSLRERVRGRLYDGAGNILTDTRSGVLYTYTYNKANRLKTVTSPSGLLGTYTYNGFEQLVARVITNSGAANGTIVTVHDLWGNPGLRRGRLNRRAMFRLRFGCPPGIRVSSGQTVREYIWLAETEIAPTRQARAQSLPRRMPRVRQSERMTSNSRILKLRTSD